MGVYSTNRSHLGNYSSEEVFANENYIGSVGALQMTLENYQNDQAIFEAVLGMDFAEAQAVNEGVEVEVFTEASVGGFIDKIKEFIKKAWEKIKGLFQTFMAKFNNVVMRDNKAFVDKYKKSVLTKDLSKMKFKWSAKKKDITIDEGELKSLADDCMDILDKSEDTLKKEVEDMNSGDYLDGILTKLIKKYGYSSTTDSKSFVKEFHEALFEDEEEIDGLNTTILTEIIGVLSEKKVISNLEKSRKAVDKYFTKLLSDINKVSNTVGKDVPSKADTNKSYKVGNSDSINYAEKDAAKHVGKLNTLYKAISITQTAVNTLTSRVLEENKFYIGQCRKVFAKAAAFNPKAVKENAIFVEAAGEAAEYEIMSTFEDYSM